MPLLLEKHLNILDFALSAFWRKKLKNLSIVVIFTLVIFLLASFHLINRALTGAAVSVLQKAPEITVQKLSAGRQESISRQYAEKITKIFGVRRVVPRIWGYYFEENSGANIMIIGMDPEQIAPLENTDKTLLKGELFTASDKGAVVTSRSVLEQLNLSGRDIFSFFRPDLTLKTFTVKGVFNPQADFLVSDVILMNIEDASDLFLLDPGKITDLCVYVTNPAEIQTVAKKIAESLPDTRVITRPQILKTYKVVFGWRSGFASVCLLTALAAFAIFAWDKASGITPEEKREIAILKVLGWETADILTMRFWEGFITSAAAFFLGISVAYIHVAYGEAALFRPVMVGWSVLFPPFDLMPEIHFADLILLFSFTVLPYLAVTVIPSWKAAVVPPDSAVNS